MFYIGWVLLQYCMRAYLYCLRTFSRLSQRKRLPHGMCPTITPLFNRLRNILAESAPLVFILVPPLSSMAENFSPSLWTSVRWDTEEGECRIYIYIYIYTSSEARQTATALLRQRPFNGAPATVIQWQSLDGTTVVSYSQFFLHLVAT